MAFAVISALLFVNALLPRPLLWAVFALAGAQAGLFALQCGAQPRRAWSSGPSSPRQERSARCAAPPGRRRRSSPSAASSSCSTAGHVRRGRRQLRRVVDRVVADVVVATGRQRAAQPARRARRTRLRPVATRIDRHLRGPDNCSATSAAMTRARRQAKRQVWLGALLLRSSAWPAGSPRWPSAACPGQAPRGTAGAAARRAAAPGRRPGPDRGEQHRNEPRSDTNKPQKKNPITNTMRRLSGQSLGAYHTELLVVLAY